MKKDMKTVINVKKEHKHCAFNLISCIIVIIATISLAGCKPPYYSEAHRKAITEENSHYALEWFETNMPEAKVKSANAYVNHNDLFKIISGEYRKDGKKHKYMYDYVNHIMYLDELYSDVCDEIDSLLLKELKGENDVLETKFSGLMIEAKTDNDTEFSAPDEEVSDTRSLEISMLPAGIEVATYAKKCLYSEDSFSITVQVYTDKIQDNIEEIVFQYKGIDVITFTAMADYDNNGVVEEVYYPDKGMCARKTWLKLIKADGEDYVGFSMNINESGLFPEDENRAEKIDALYTQLEESEIKYEKIDSKKYKISVPVHTNPIVLSKHKFAAMEKADIVKDSSKGYKKYYLVPGIIRLPDKGLNLFYKDVTYAPDAEEYEFSYK